MSKKPANPAIRKAVTVLEELAASPEPLRYSDLIQRTGLPRASLFRILSSLREENLVRLDECTHRYELGQRLLTLAVDSSGKSPLERIAASELQRLSQATGETVHLAVSDGTQMLYTSQYEGSRTVRVASKAVKRAPIYCTAVGKAYLAFRPPAEQEELVPRFDFHAHTDRTTQNAAQLREALVATARQGYAIDEGEWESGLHCLAAPILNRKGRSVASLGISAPAFRAESRMSDWIDLVVAAASSISQQLSGRTTSDRQQ